MEPGLSRGPGVEVERAVLEVWYSSRSGSRSGKGVVGSNPTVVTTMEPGLSRGPGVEVERAVPEVWYSSRSGSRSGKGVAELKSKQRGRRGVEVP